MSFVKSVIAARKAQETLVEGRFLNWLETSPDSYKHEPETFQASQMYSVCPRRQVMDERHPITTVHSAKTKAKFAIGHALHHWYQNKYFGPMGILRGNWMCLRCQKRYKDCLMPTEPCKKCGSKDGYEYEELTVRSTEWDIAGHVDGILDIDGVSYVMDIKTMDPDMFKRLTAPYAPAVFQVNLYMWMLNIHRGVLIYLDKSANGITPLKEFPVDFDPEAITVMQSKVSSYRIAKSSKTLPPRLCAEVACPRARGCPHSEQCFDDTWCAEFLKKWQEEEVEREVESIREQCSQDAE